MHLSAALQYSWEKGSVNAKQCVAPISMPGFRLLGLEPRSRFTIVRDLTQNGWRATRLRRGGCPQPAGGAKLRRLGFMQDQANCARPDEGVGLRQYVSIVVNDFPYARGRALSKRNVLEPRYVFSISRTFSIPSVSVNFTSITSFMVVATVRPTKSAAIGNSR